MNSLLRRIGVAPNPTPEINPFGWLALAGIGVAAAVLWWTRPAKAAPAACTIDVQKLHGWGLSKGVPVFYLFATDAPPPLSGIQAFGATATELEQDFVVVLKDGSFWTYDGETPVAAPALRGEYCAATS